MEDKPQITIERKEKPSSYEFGKASNRFKLYFDTPEELKKMIDKLIELGIYANEGEI